MTTIQRAFNISIANTMRKHLMFDLFSIKQKAWEAKCVPKKDVIFAIKLTSSLCSGFLHLLATVHYIILLLPKK